VEEIGNRFEGDGRSGSSSSYEASIFEPPLTGSEVDGESLVSELVG